MQILTTVELAELLGTSPSSISRAAKRANVGVRREDGRLVGVVKADVRKLKKLLKFKAGNPNWVKK